MSSLSFLLAVKLSDETIFTTAAAIWRGSFHYIDFSDEEREKTESPPPQDLTVFTLLQ